MKKGDLRNFAKFTGKRLCQSLFYQNLIWRKVIINRDCSFSTSAKFFEKLTFLTPLYAHVRNLMAI